MSQRGRSRGGGRAENPVSLFPFLSVLICTMGTLILLLVVINRSARTQAAERSGLNTDEIIAELDVEAQTFEVFANDLQISKAKTAEDIATESLRLATLEQSIENMVAEINRAEAALKNLNASQGVKNSEAGKLNETLAAKRAALQMAEQELKELQDNATNRKSSYAIIPYRGANGTKRRPVYIECRDDCVIVQPEGIVLKEDDFLTASHPDNPLDALLRATSLFYTEQELVPRGTKPYPLIIVRPGGIDAYYAVRESIKSWGEQFGYELVEEDWKLEVPAANEALKQRLEAQLAASRERMIPFKAMIMQRYAATNRLSGDVTGNRNPGMPGASGSPNMSGTVGMQGMPGMPGDAFGQGRFNDRLSGEITGLADDRLMGGEMPQNGNGRGVNGVNGVNGSNGGEGQRGNFENIDWQEVMSTVGGSYAAGSAKKPEVEYRVGPNGNMVRYVDGVPSEARVASGSGQRNAGERNAQGGGTRANTSGQQGTGQPGGFLAQGTPGAYPAATGPQYAAARAPEPTVMQPGQLYPETQTSGGTFAGQQNGMTTTAGNATNLVNQPFAANQGAIADPANAANVDLNNAGSLTAMQNDWGNATASPQTRGQYSASGDAASQNATSSCPAGGENMAGSENTMPSMGMTLGDKPPGSAKPYMPMSNWAMPNVGQGATEMARPISVECRTDKILIKRTGGAGVDREIAIPANGGVYNVTNTLVSHFCDYIDTWGTAARGTCWQPEMNVVVQPGAEARFEELKSLMQNSGMRIRRVEAKPRF